MYISLGRDLYQPDCVAVLDTEDMAVDYIKLGALQSMLNTLGAKLVQFISINSRSAVGDVEMDLLAVYAGGQISLFKRGMGLINTVNVPALPPHVEYPYVSCYEKCGVYLVSILGEDKHYYGEDKEQEFIWSVRFNANGDILDCDDRFKEHRR